MTNHLETGKYPPDHRFAKYSLVGFKEMTYKHHRLSINRGFFENSKHWRIPVINPKCYKDPGGTLLRYRDTWHPGQERFHTMLLTYKQMIACRYKGLDKVLYCTNRPIGKTKVARMFKEGARILNINDPERFTGHALRLVYITKIINNPNVNQKESQLATRHGSVLAQLPYIVPNEHSEVEKPKALGI